MGLLLIFNGFYQGSSIEDSIRSISGSLVAMIPSGMYLLTSVTLAVGVLRLGRKKTLVNEMYSIEMLARVNVLCLDKTGTITDGTMKVNDVILLKNTKLDHVHKVVTSIIKATEDANPTALALAKHFDTKVAITASKAIPFNSESKYSGATLNGTTYIIGASKIVLSKKNHKTIAELERIYLERGLRVLVLASADKPIINGNLPIDLAPLALIIIQDNIRTEALSAITHFQNAGVEIKIISGDDPISVGEIARQVGINNSEKLLDFSEINNLNEYALEDFAIYGRVKPEQKEGIITKLQNDGKVVAMIGDGVNDVLALKAAQCSIAMGEGSAAARGVSHLVLLDNNFDVLPSIVDEGRRAINNLQKTWALFLVKTTFAILFTLLFVAAGLLGPKNSGIRYPFEPRHLYLWEFLALGIPAFFLSMQPNTDRVQGTFLNNVIRRSLPAGMFIVAAAFILYISKNFEEMFGAVVSDTSATMITMSIITLTVLSFLVLLRNSLPFNKYRAIVFTTLSIATLGLVLLDNFVGLTIDRTDTLFGINFSSLHLLNYLIMITVIVVIGGLYIYVDTKLVPKHEGRE